MEYFGNDTGASVPFDTGTTSLNLPKGASMETGFDRSSRQQASVSAGAPWVIQLTTAQISTITCGDR